MSGLESFKCKPRQIVKFVEKAIMAGRVPYVKSSPGMGKSSIMYQIAKKHNLFVIDHRLSTSVPEDLSGLPKFKTKPIIDEQGNIIGEYDVATFVAFDMFPVEGTPLPKGYDGWLIFLDEFNSAKKEVQAAAYKLILDKAVGLQKLHSRVAIACAGNLTTDRAIVNPLSTAMQSRVITLEMKIDFREWFEDVALANEYDPRIQAFLNMNQDNLMDFRPDHNENTFCCPRTWEFMNDFCKGGQEVSDEYAPLYAGTITSGVATQFIKFTEVAGSIPSVAQIISDPEKTRIPDQPEGKYFVTISLLSQLTEENIDKIVIYINQMNSDFRVIFFRGIIARYPQLRAHPAYRAAAVELSRYLNED